MTLLRWTSLGTLMLAMACGTRAVGGAVQSAPAGAMASEPQTPTAPEQASSNAAARLAHLEAADAAGLSREGQPAKVPIPATSDAPIAGAGESKTQPQPVGQDSAAVIPARPMMDIEARLAVEVKDVGASLGEVRSLVVASGGQILEESLEDTKHERPTARLTARVPAAGAFDFMARLEATGVVRSRQVNSRDVGKEYFDASLRVGSLEQVLSRLHDLLAKATTIEETLRVEEQIARVSGEIESIKGELRWLKDRVARATIRLEIYAKGDWIEPVVTPEAKLYPGIRAVGSWDWRGDAGSRYGIGAGLSLRFSRHFSVDFDGLQNTKARGGGLEAALLTLGSEFYSDFLGAGRRRWFNPYLGLRGGYARVDGNDQLVAGGTLGLELLKSDGVVLSFDLRMFGAFGDHLNSHLIVLPALGANFAF